MSYDLLLKGGVIYNGAGTPGVHGDVAVQGGQIVAVGSVGELRNYRTLGSFDGGEEKQRVSTYLDVQGIGNCLNCVLDTYTWTVAMSESASRSYWCSRD